MRRQFEPIPDPVATRAATHLPERAWPAEVPRARVRPRRLRVLMLDGAPPGGRGARPTGPGPLGTRVPDVAFIRLPVRERDADPDLATIVRTRPVDLVHIPGDRASEGLVEAAADRRLPLVLHVRGIHDSAFPPAALGPLPMANWLSTSHALRESILARGVPDHRISVIHDPVDCARFDAGATHRAQVRASIGLAPDDVAIGVLGPVGAGSGHAHFVDAMLRAVRRDPRLRGVLVSEDGGGAGPGAFADVVRMVWRSGHPSRFLFVDHPIPLESHLHAMDIVADPSLRPDPTGRRALEAMAAGRPIVAAPLGGVAEILTDEVDGQFRDPRDPEALADAYVRLARDPQRRRSMGEAGRRTARELFSPESIGREIRALYDRLLAERPATRPRPKLLTSPEID